MVRTLTAFVFAALLTVAVGTAQAAGPDAKATARPHVSLMLGIARIGDRLIAVGERGSVLLSDDSGNTWRSAPTGSEATLTHITVVGPKSAYAVGWDATILRTDDAGESWVKQHEDTSQDNGLFAVVGLPDGRALAGGTYGLFYETEDGKSWKDLHNDTLDPDAHTNALVTPTANRILLAGEAGSLYLSEDAGKAWKHLDFPYKGSLFGALALGADDWLVFGLRGHAFRTQDAGAHWVSLPTDTPVGLMGGAVLTDGRVVLVGSGGAVVVSDAGVTRFSALPQPQHQTLSEVVQAPDGSLVAVGDAGISTDESSFVHIAVPAKVAVKQ
jgi:photosystem II stability/assembly factor-like uncharacterized protein